MPSKFTWIATASCFLASALSQNNDTLKVETPPEEAETISTLALADESPLPPDNNTSPAYPLIYGVELPIPPKKEPVKIVKNPVTGKDIHYFEFEIKPFEKQVYPDLGATRLIGYDGMFPGPTIVVPRGTESVVRFMNQGDLPNSVHLHGSPSRAPFDGWAEDTTAVGEYKDYYYGNSQSARLIWYHDHAMHNTTVNAYMGQAGGYVITDPAEDALGLPSGYGEFDIPLILSSATYKSDGGLLVPSPSTNLFGDTIHVNGQPWPFFKVQPRKYRLRFLNGAVTRAFALYFAAQSDLEAKIKFQVIASDAGLLEGPVEVDTVYAAMAERYEVVFDFTNFAGQSIELRNINQANGISDETNYPNIEKVMRFDVSSDPVADSSTVPTTLRSVPFPPPTDVVKHQFRFFAREDFTMTINNVTFSDVENRVLAKPERGTVEIWELINNSTNFTHPVHLHLVDFRVLNRTKVNGELSRGVEPYESVGLKDVVWLGVMENVTVEAHYAPWDGVYMFHCHNLIHEDNDMMGVFNVTTLENLGYNETTDFSDPLDPRWRSQPYNTADFTGRTGIFSDDAITEKVEKLAREQPYSEEDKVEEALTNYWNEHNSSTPVQSRSAPAPRRRRFVV